MGHTAGTYRATATLGEHEVIHAGCRGREPTPTPTPTPTLTPILTPTPHRCRRRHDTIRRDPPQANTTTTPHHAMHHPTGARLERREEKKGQRIKASHATLPPSTARRPSPSTSPSTSAPHRPGTRPSLHPPDRRAKQSHPTRPPSHPPPLPLLVMFPATFRRHVRRSASSSPTPPILSRHLGDSLPGVLVLSCFGLSLASRRPACGVVVLVCCCWVRRGGG